VQKEFIEKRKKQQIKSICIDIRTNFKCVFHIVFVRAILSWCPYTWHVYIINTILSLNISSNDYMRRYLKMSSLHMSFRMNTVSVKKYTRIFSLIKFKPLEKGYFNKTPFIHFNCLFNSKKMGCNQLSKQNAFTIVTFYFRVYPYQYFIALITHPKLNKCILCFC